MPYTFDKINYCDSGPFPNMKVPCEVVSTSESCTASLLGGGQNYTVHHEHGFTNGWLQKILSCYQHFQSSTNVKLAEDYS